MNKKAERKKNKKRKMAAFLQLVEMKDNADAKDSSSSQQLKVTEMDKDCSESRKRAIELNQSEKSLEDINDDIALAYRTMMAKKRKYDEENFRQTVKFYIDQYYLSMTRQKFLLYNEKAEKLTNPIAIYPCDVQSFIMYNLFKRCSFYRPRWCTIDFVKSVKQMVVLIVNDVSWADVNISQPAVWSKANALLSRHCVRVVSPQHFYGDIEEDLFLVPLPPGEVSNSNKTGNDNSEVTGKVDDNMELDVDQLLNSPDVFPRTMILLPFTELVAEGFPLPAHQTVRCQDSSYDGFTFSKNTYTKVSDKSPMYAIDCEMVMTSDNRLSLASVCIIDEKLRLVYKKLVKPELKIIDYLTQFSGITEKMLSGVITTLPDVQEEIKELLPPDAILCGQSLNSDLTALKLYHPYVIDTSVCYNLRGMPHSKTALRRLSSYFLKKDIQVGSAGHCPEEDARTAMELVLLKLKVGYTFGNALTDDCIMTTPSKFFKSPTPSGEIKPAEELLQATNDHHIQDSIALCVINAPQRNPETSVQDDSKSQSVSETVVVSVPHISQHAVFSRRNIPQLEVNMFDLVGRRDDNKASICTQHLVIQPPQNSDSVQLHLNKKSKSVIKAAVKSIKSGANMVYCRLSGPKSTSQHDVKKHAFKTDSYILSLWDSLPVGGLFCLVLAGTDTQPGAIMFDSKSKQASHTQVSSDCSPATETESSVEIDGDVYAAMYGV